MIAPTWPRSALDNREVSSPVEEGARGEVEGHFIAKKCKISKRERRDHGTMPCGQWQACTAEQQRKLQLLVDIVSF